MLSESGATTSATVVVVCVVLAGLVRHLVRAAPVLMREWHIRTLLRRALTGQTKAERDRAYALLQLILTEPSESRPIEPPDG